MGLLNRVFQPRKAAFDDAIAWLVRFVDDEEYQNSLLDPPIRQLSLLGAPVDQLPNGHGAFGTSLRNPIPVNGAMGELAYLSKLRTEAGERLLFHRLGSVDDIDVFEAVTWNGNDWHIFYLDMYHPRRSRKAPAGFILGEGPSHFGGFSQFCCKNFPLDFLEYRARLAVKRDFDLAYISAVTIEKILGSASFGVTGEYLVRKVAAEIRLTGSQG
jgi:hypothetical protein